MTLTEAKKQFEDAVSKDDGTVMSARRIKFAARDLTNAAEEQVIDRLDDIQRVGMDKLMTTILGVS